MAGRPDTPVPDGWRVVRLRDGVRLASGESPRYVDDANSAVPVIGANGRIGSTDRPNVTWGLAVGRVGASGSVRRIQEPVWLSDNALLVEPDTEKWDGSFLYQALLQARLPSLASQTAQPLLTQSALGGVALLLPPLPEQRAIAAVLDTIYEAIERTDAVIAATEELRRALLHELLTCGLPGHHTAWREVPGLGTIPACWEVVRLGDVCAPPSYGAAAPAQPCDPELPRYVRITDITDDGRLRSEDARSADPSQVKGFELEPGDLLFARSGSVGRTYLYRSEDGPCVFAGYLIRFRPNPEIALPRFVELYTHSFSYRRWIASILRVGAQPNINAAEYNSLPILLPPLPEQRAIAATLDSVDATIERVRAERAALQSSKASTADALLTGRVRVGVI